MNNEQIAEEVAKRMVGKQYEVLSRETVYYSRTVWAESKADAERICMDEGDWGEAVDGSDFVIDGVEEV
jgi:hypothetical protein